MGLPEGNLVAEGLAGLDLDQLDAPRVWAFLRQELFGAAATNRHPFHLFTLATTDETGAPSARTVVLRRFLGHEREVWFHTDLRSPKVGQLRRDSRVGLLWYDPHSRVQFRIPARVKLHHLDEKAKQAWDKSPPMTRSCYGDLQGPGEILNRDTVATSSDVLPAVMQIQGDTHIEKDDSGWGNFVAVCCHFDTMDLLLLKASGHQRARIDFVANPVTWERLAP